MDERATLSAGGPGAPPQIEYQLRIAGRALHAHRVEGREALSETSSFTVSAILPVRDDFETDDACGTECELAIRRGGADVRVLRLTATSVERSASADPEKVGVPLDVVLESPLSLLRHRVDIRIFRDLDVPTIVARVLGAFGIGVERRLASGYAIRPYTVQWRESDLAFVSRLLEDEGIYYVALASGGVILGDSSAAPSDAGSISFVHRANLDPSTESVTDAGWAGKMTPSRVTMRDFDFKKPQLDVTSTASVASKSSAAGGEHYEYPAARLDPGGAATKATRTAEAFLAAQHRLAGKATRLTLAPNDAVKIGGLPSGLEDGEFTIVSIAHRWDVAKTEFSVSFEAIPKASPFRPMPETPRPSLVGATVGTITGPAGEDIHTDEWGRTKVHFHWDRLQPKDDRCSYWVPTLQDNTGHSIGIPRVGWEVMVQHLEGDPDRPMILGRVYTPADDFHSKLPENKMFSALRSVSSPRGPGGEATGYNSIEFRDLADNEQLRFHAERDQVVLTENDRTETTKERDGREVRGNEAVKVGKSRTHDVAKTVNALVEKNQTVKIGNDRRLTVGGQLSEVSTGDRSLKIGSTHMRRFDTMDEVKVGANLSETIGALNLEASVQGSQSNTGKSEALLVGGAIIELAKQTIMQTTQKARVELIGALLHQEAKEHVGLRASTKRTTTTGGDYKAKSGTAILLSGLEKLELVVGEFALAAKKKLTLKVQNTTVILDTDHHSIDAPQEITAHADARNDLNAAHSGQNDAAGGR